MNRPLLFSILCVVQVTSIINAADRDFVGKLILLEDEQVIQKLAIGKETKAKIDEFLSRRMKEGEQIVLKTKMLPDGFAVESERQGLALLSEEQRKSLEQVRIEQLGLSTLGEPPIAAQLKLADDQINRIRELLAERQQESTKGGELQRSITAGKYERKLREVLTDDQQLAWRRLAGLELGDEPAKDPPANETADKPKEDKPAADEKKQTEKKEPGKIEPGKEAVVADDDPSLVPLTEPKLFFSFSKVVWAKVLEEMAEQWQLSLQTVETPPSGVFNYKDTNKHTLTESMDIINAALLFRGFTLVRNKRMLVLVNLEDGVPTEAIETVTPETLDERGKFEFLKCLFPLGSLTADDVERELRPLVPEADAMKVMPTSAHVLIQETGSNLRMIRAVMESANKVAAARASEVEIYALQFAAPEAVLEIARPLLGMGEEELSTEDGTLKIAFDSLSGRMFYSGEAEMVKQFKQILEKVDVDPGGTPGGAVEEFVLQVHSVRGDPDTALQVVQVMFAGEEGMRVAKDPGTGNLIALARASQHERIDGIIQQMKKDAVNFDVIQLNRVDPTSMVLLLNKLLGKDLEENANKGPTYDGDPVTMQLVVRGTASEIEQIKTIVEKMDPQFGSDGSELRTNSRLIPLTGQAGEILDLAELMWPAGGRTNRIRQVITGESRRSLDERDTRPPTRTRPLPPIREPDPQEEKAPPEKESKPASNKGINLENTIDKSANVGRKPSVVFVRRGRHDRRASVVRRGSLVPVATVAQRSQERNGSSTVWVNRSNALKQRPVIVRQVSQRNEDAEEKDIEEKKAAETKQPEEKSAKDNKPEIVVRIIPQGLLISSDDLDALDDYEDLIRSLMSGNVLPPKPTIFYLKNAKAPEAAALLESILGISSGGGGGGGGGFGSLMGDMASNLVGGVGGDLLGGLLGGGGDTGASGSLQTTGTVQITPDVRLNAVIVQANAADIELVEQLLDIIDQDSPPQDPDTSGRTYIIPVYYMMADEMANTVRQAFPQHIVGADSGSQQRQPSPQDFLRALSGRRGGGGGQNREIGEERKMTVGIDSRSNSLVVTGPEHLYKKVLALVEELDQEGLNSTESFSVIRLNGGVNAATLSDALKSLLGDAVQTNTTSSSSNNQQSQSGQQRSGQPQQNQTNFDEIRRRFEFMRNMQQRSQQGGGGGPSRGGPSRGSPSGRGPGGGSFRGGR